MKKDRQVKKEWWIMKNTRDYQTWTLYRLALISSWNLEKQKKQNDNLKMLNIVHNKKTQQEESAET